MARGAINRKIVGSRVSQFCPLPIKLLKCSLFISCTRRRVDVHEPFIKPIFSAIEVDLYAVNIPCCEDDLRNRTKKIAYSRCLYGRRLAELRHKHLEVAFLKLHAHGIKSNTFNFAIHQLNNGRTATYQLGSVVG